MTLDFAHQIAKSGFNQEIERLSFGFFQSGQAKNVFSMQYVLYLCYFTQVLSKLPLIWAKTG